MGVWACVHYGVPNKGRLGSGVPHREPSVLHVVVEAVAGDLGASQASSQLPGGGSLPTHPLPPPCCDEASRYASQKNPVTD